MWPCQVVSRGAREGWSSARWHQLVLCRATDGKVLDRKPVAGLWDSVRAGSAWHSRANHDVQDDRVPVSRLDRQEDFNVSWSPAETFFQPELRLAVTGRAGGVSPQSGRVPWLGGDSFDEA